MVLSLAWHTAYLERVKRLPRLEKLLDVRKPRRVTRAEVEAEWSELRRRLPDG